MVPSVTYAKRGAGKIIAIILGSLMTLAGFVLAIGDIAVLVESIGEGSLDGAGIFAFIVLLLPLILGILLLVVGLKRKKIPVTAQTSALPVQQNAAPVMQQNATPVVQNTGAVNQQNGAPSNTGNYAYAPTALLQDESDKMLKKKARNAGLGAIALTALFWVLTFAIDMSSYWLLILPFILSFSALKMSRGKSVAGWIAMILAILSVVFLVLVLALAVTMR